VGSPRPFPGRWRRAPLRRPPAAPRMVSVELPGTVEMAMEEVAEDGQDGLLTRSMVPPKPEPRAAPNAPPGPIPVLDERPGTAPKQLTTTWNKNGLSEKNGLTDALHALHQTTNGQSHFPPPPQVGAQVGTYGSEVSQGGVAAVQSLQSEDFKMAPEEQELADRLVREEEREEQDRLQEEQTCRREDTLERQRRAERDRLERLGMRMRAERSEPRPEPKEERHPLINWFDAEVRDELRTINRKLDELRMQLKNGSKRLHRGHTESDMAVLEPQERASRTSVNSSRRSSMDRRASVDEKARVDPGVVKCLYRQRSMMLPMSNGLEMVLSTQPPAVTAQTDQPNSSRSFTAGWPFRRSNTMYKVDTHIEKKGSDGDQGDMPQKINSSHSVLNGGDVATTEDLMKRWRTLGEDDIAKANALLVGKNGFSLRRSIWNFIENPESGVAAKWFAQAWFIFIVLATLVTVTQGIDDPPLNGWTAAVLETIIDVIFLLELIIRFICCPSKWVWFIGIYTWLDVLAAAPLLVRIPSGFVLPTGEVQTVPHAVLLCAVPIVRLLKTLRRFEKFHLLIKAFGLAAEALPVLLYILTVIAMFFSALIYLVEPRDNITSLPFSFYFCIVTMTTVGYGDITPTTTAGNCVVGVLVVFTVLYMAIPLGIIGSAFTDTWQDRDRILLMQRTRDRLCQWGYTAHDIPVLFRISDANSDGELNITEFRKLLNEMKVGFSEERILKLFNSFDDDGSGTVDDREFVRALFPEAYHDIYTDD